MNSKYLIPFLFLLGLFFYSFLKTDRKYTFYSLDGCNTELTVLEYSSISERGVAFIRGHYTEDNLPKNNLILKETMSGFDSYFECIPTCEKGIILINYYEDTFINSYKSDSIKAILLNSEGYSRLRSVNPVIVKIF